MDTLDPQQHNTLSLQDHSSMGSGTMSLEAEQQTSCPLRPFCRCFIHKNACTRMYTSQSGKAEKLDARSG